MGIFILRSSASAGGGDSGEVSTSWANFDLEENEINRLDFSAQDYPIWTPDNATHHTYRATGAWDGSPSARILAPIIEQTACGLGGFDNLWKLGTFPIRKLNIEFQFLAGPTLWQNWFGADWKFMIVHTWPSLIADPDPGGGERPMMNFVRYDGTESDHVQAWAVGAGTVKDFNDDMYMGAQDGTWMSSPVYGPGEWFSVEFEVIPEVTAEAPNGRIRGVFTRRTGESYSVTIPWNFDSNWTVDDYVHTVQLIGGFWNDAASSRDANTYYELANIRMAANRSGLLGPRTGFVTG